MLRQPLMLLHRSDTRSFTQSVHYNECSAVTQTARFITLPRQCLCHTFRNYNSVRFHGGYILHCLQCETTIPCHGTLIFDVSKTAVTPILNTKWLNTKEVLRFLCIPLMLSNQSCREYEYLTYWRLQECSGYTHCLHTLRTGSFWLGSELLTYHS
jgi:hypothetical protein